MLIDVDFPKCLSILAVFFIRKSVYFIVFPKTQVKNPARTGKR